VKNFVRSHLKWKKAVVLVIPVIAQKLKIGELQFRLAWVKSKTLPPK
jgi:hypothetical protein